MALTMKRQRNGELRRDWYGVYSDGGKRRVVNLGVEWKGTPPASGRVGDAGDEAFERSRVKALDALRAFTDEAGRKGKADTLTERLIESKTGRAVEYVRLADLPARWRALGRDAAPSERYLKSCDAAFRRFNEYMATRNPAAVYLYETTAADAAAFYTACREVLAPATAKDGLRLLNKAFAVCLPVGAENPFAGLMRRRRNGDGGTVHREPFTADELRLLMDAARDDAFMYPLVVCAAMTGMRRGDVCRLTWDAVDLAGGMLDVATHKTGARVEIPIFPPLAEVLRDAETRKGFVWPDAARMIEENPDGLTWRFKKIVCKALGGTESGEAVTDAAAIRGEAVAAITRQVTKETMAARMIETFDLYAAGQSVRQIEAATGIWRASISQYLHRIEQWTGARFLRGGGKRPDTKASIAALTRKDRAQGRAASVKDWHALRVTWVTLALESGVPVELVRRVTGHATVEIVLRHYFRPGRDSFRRALGDALPDVLTGGNGPAAIGAGKRTGKALPPADELAALVGMVQSGAATEADRRRLRLLAAKI